MDYGLALSGGGARGSAHIGILMALAEENMLPSSIRRNECRKYYRRLICCKYFY